MLRQLYSQRLRMMDGVTFMIGDYSFAAGGAERIGLCEVDIAASGDALAGYWADIATETVAVPIAEPTRRQICEVRIASLSQLDRVYVSAPLPDLADLRLEGQVIYLVTGRRVQSDHAAIALRAGRRSAFLCRTAILDYIAKSSEFAEEVAGDACGSL